MRLLTFHSESGEPHIGVLHGDLVFDLAPLFGSLQMLDLLRMGDEGLARVKDALESGFGTLIPIDEQRLLAPIPRPPKNVICVGRNYPEHAAEMVRAFGEAPAAPPQYPTVFTKAPTTVNGPYADILYDPSITEKLDWEAELVVIIGKAGKRIPRSEALNHVFGYTVLNDVSARDIQKRHGGQNFLGKSLDGACPMGPWIVTSDEISDPHNLEVWSKVNGVEKQRANTGQMTYDIPAIIESVSLGMTLEPGDIIATGTPDGVGNARIPPEFLHAGDVVECGVEGIGVIRNRIVDDRLSAIGYQPSAKDR